jgi:hypothetical protein
MKTTIKLMLLAAVGAALMAVPASVQYSPAPGVFQNDTVNQGGQYLGRDPDPSVRSEILKDDSEYNGNGY